MLCQVTQFAGVGQSEFDRRMGRILGAALDAMLSGLDDRIWEARS